MESKPGFRFHPTDKELINYYLKNKILGNTWLVDDTINEINILNYHPASLSSLSRIKSNDRMYYFFAPKQYKTAKTNLTKRSIRSGYWERTGDVRKIEDESGTKIGGRRYFVFKDHEAPKAKGKKSPWVMHEYQITHLPHHKLDSYVICKIFDKRKEANISYGNNSSEPSQSLVSDSNTVREISIPPEIQVEQPREENVYDLINPMDGSADPNTLFSDNNNPNVQLQTPYLPQNDEMPPVYPGTAQHLLSNQEFTMQDKYNDYMLKNTVTLPESGQENFYGLSVADLSAPVNEQENLFAFDPNTSFSDNNNPNVQLQTPYGDDYWSGLLGYNGGNFEDVFSDQGFIMQENRNDYRPKKSLSGIIVDYSSDSDSDSESISATSYKGTSSPDDSVGSSNSHFLQTCEDEILSLRKDIQTSVEPSISRKTRESQLARGSIPSKQEVKQGMVKTEKKGLLITEEAIERKRENPPYIYLINMIIAFILLLALIGDTISVYN